MEAAATAGSSSPMQWESKEDEEHARREAEEAWQAYLRQQRSRSVWAQYLRCRPMSLLGKDDGNWVVMPASALDRIQSVRMDYPLLFRVQNAATLEASHCGVLEFGCEEGFVHVPALTMARLGLEEGNLVLVTSTSLPKATSIKLRPHTTDFLGARDHKELLEYNLKNYSMVTVGDTITVADGDKRYLLDVLEAMPTDAVSTLDTDCEVDFAPPLDYVEPPVAPAATAAPCQDCAHGGERRFVGVGIRMDGKPVEPPVAPAPVKVATAPCQDCTNSGERRFVGVGIRMDGKPVEQTPPLASAPAAGSSGKGKSASEHVLRFFGGRGSVAVAPPGRMSAKKVDGEEDKEAKRFTGQKYTL